MIWYFYRLYTIVYTTLATRCKELTHWKRHWCWERLKAGGEGDSIRWDGWMALPTQWAWVWASSGSWWWTGKPGVLQSLGWQRVGHDWVTELIDCTPYKVIVMLLTIFPFCTLHPLPVTLFYNWHLLIRDLIPFHLFFPFLPAPNRPSPLATTGLFSVFVVCFCFMYSLALIFRFDI